MPANDPFFQGALTQFDEPWGVYGNPNAIGVGDVIPTGIQWLLEFDNECDPEPWTLSADNTRLRYDVVDSENCGGTCDVIQSGTAIANITVGSKDAFMNLSFEGSGEIQDSDFELIAFFLDGVELARAHALGGSNGCGSAPVVKEILVPGPYLLESGRNYEFRVSFTTNDNLYHVNAFYQIEIGFSNVS